MMDDLIKRQDAIDALWKALYDYEDKTEKQFLESEELNTDDWFQHRIFVQNMSDIDRQTILNLPSANPWIPCSEGLPKTDNWRTTFNVTTETGFVTSMEWENTTVRGKPVSRWVWQDRIAPWEVVAWKPLPEPYKAESEESK